jgi:hypothetical protein
MPASQPEAYAAIAAAQREFAALLLVPQPLAPQATHAWPGLELAAYPDASRAALGLRIYRNNVLYSLVQALRAQFPLVETLVGTAFFGALARDYVFHAPPRDASLTFYGATLPDFIAAAPACRELPYLADVARLELLCQYALHAADAAVLDPRELSTFAPERLGALRFNLHPSAALLASPYPLERIRQTALREDAPALELAAQEPAYLLVHRPVADVLVAALQPATFMLLQRLQQGQTLEAAWHHVQAALTLATADFIPLFAGVLQLAVLTSIHSDTGESLP